MRHALIGPTFALALLPGAASAWSAGVDGPLCTLDHSEPGLDVRLTYDPSGPLYSITLTAETPWPEGPIFAMAFQGGQENIISTGRHMRSEDGRALSVTDRGFGNVLDGLAGNSLAIAFIGESQRGFGLDGAAPAVETFRACATAQLS